MRCPFGPCLWIGDLIPMRPTSERPELTIQTIPQHAIEGPADWFAPLCPASLIPVPVTAEYAEQLQHSLNSYRIAKERRDAGRSIAGPVWSGPPGVRHGSKRQTDDPNAAESCAVCSASGRVALFSARGDLIDHLLNAHGVDVRVDINPPPGGIIDAFFPIRPAESEHDEPGPDTRRGGVFNVSGDNRTGQQGTLLMASQAASEAQGACAHITDGLDRALAGLEGLALHHQAAAAMVLAAVDASDPSLPEPARRMVQGAQELGQLVTELRALIQRAQGVNGSAFSEAVNVQTGADEYLGMI